MEASALSVISDNLRIIGVSQNRWDVIRQHYPESAISIFNKEYEQWDGMALIRHRDNSQTDQQYLGVNQKLLLSISAYHGKIMYGLYAQLPDAEPGEDFTYNSSEFGEFSFSISRDCLSFDCKWNDSIKSAVLKNNPVVFLKEGDNTVKLTYKPSNIEILESHYDKFISSRKFQAGRKYRVLIKNSEIDKYSTWLVENNAQLIQNHDLNDAYSLYSIDCAKTDLQTSELKKLHFDEKIDAKVVDTIILRRADNGAIVLYRDLPAYFQVSGIDVSKNKVRAVFNSDGGMEEVHLQYDEGANVWKLPVITNKFTLQKTFQLYCDTKLISSTSYKVDDFNIMPTAEYDEICYNEYGEVDYNGKFKGLQLPPSHNVNWENLESSMSREGRPPKPQNSEYRFTDFLLYYISTRPRLERKEFEDIINMLIHNDIFEFKIENKWSRRTLLDNYFRLGYCNYAYMDGKHIISVNKPTMVLLPPKVKRTKFGNIVRLEHTENFWTVFLSGARTPDTIKALQNSLSSFKYEGNKIMMEVKPSSDGLLPQSVYLRSESLEAIEKFAKMNGYEFQKNIYSNCLLQDLASVDDYLRHIMSVESPEVYDGIMNCETIDYKELAATGQFRKVKNFETNKAVVTYFPNTFREVSIIWSDGKQYQSDKHWGHFVGMHFADAQVLIYDKEDSKFKLPIFIQLPKLYARALSLISGEIPHEEGRIRTYELYENPYVHSVDSDSIIKKLS